MDLVTRPCEQPHCPAQVVDVNVIPTSPRARLKRETIDPEPASWADGGRFRLDAHQPNASKGRYNGRAVTAGTAFGHKLYRLHSKSCAGKRAPTGKGIN